jgi:prepilin peptidase CpaA
MAHIHYIILLPVAAAVLIATITDLHSRRIPNWLVGPFLLSGMATAAVLHGWSGIGNSLSGILIGAGVFGLFAWRGGMGMGDVKLCAAAGGWLGPHQLFIGLVLTAIAGGLLAIGWVLVNKRARAIPYAPAIAAGMLLSFWAR